MVLDLPATLRLVSHELRSPLGVIQGYLRMLGDGRIEDSMRPRVIAQMQRAAARLASIGQQASELSHWISDAPRGHQDISIGELLEEIGSRSSQTIRVSGLATPEYAGLSVRTPDLAALAVAGAALVEVVARKSGAMVALAAAPAAEPGDIDIWVAPATLTVDRALIRRPQERRAVDLEEGGMGLSLLIAAAVVDAHGGQLWQSTSQLVFGMTVRRGAQS
jgi:signal transduction histidine kinase